jgi:hypothetical protein
MKKLTILTAVFGVMCFAACRPTDRHIVISEGSDSDDLKIEYFGRALFNYDTTAIARISKNGLVKYRRNGRTLVAENGLHGKIVYRIDGGKSQTELAESDKAFVARVVKDMAKKGFNTDRKK